jgi:hypothetical protein
MHELQVNEQIPPAFPLLRQGVEAVSRYRADLGARRSWFNFWIFATHSQFMSLVTTGQENLLQFQRNSDISDIKPEVHHIAILDDVFLAL